MMNLPFPFHRGEEEGLLPTDWFLYSNGFRAPPELSEDACAVGK